MPQDQADSFSRPGADLAANRPISNNPFHIVGDSLKPLSQRSEIRRPQLAAVARQILQEQQRLAVAIRSTAD
jgi:hypothetical protein